MRGYDKGFYENENKSKEGSVTPNEERKISPYIRKPDVNSAEEESKYKTPNTVHKEAGSEETYGPNQIVKRGNGSKPSERFIKANIDDYNNIGGKK